LWYWDVNLASGKSVAVCVGLVQPEAVEQAQLNAQRNGITNVMFQVGPVEKLLPQLDTPDIVLLDPPRKVRSRPDRNFAASSAALSTSAVTRHLARDLKLLCQDGKYRLTMVQPADFFPQTAHVECRLPCAMMLN